MALATRPKPSAHHKKRQGSHHRRSKDYLKTYWPYLPMLMIVAVGLMINSIWNGYGHVLGSGSDFSTTTFLNATNADRSAAHESPLTLDSRLTTAAQAKANDMVAKNYWSHNAPDGSTPWSFITAAGYTYAVAGENLAYGFANATDTEAGWMTSPEHRANIVDSAYQNVGFGVASSSDFQGHGPETVVVAEYAAPPATAANITFKVPPAPKPQPSPTDTYAPSQAAITPTPATPSSSPTVTPQASIAAAAVTPAPTELAAQKVSRVQVLTGGQAAWSALALTVLAGAAVTLLLLRHGRHWHRLLTRGEFLLAHHPLWDLSLAFIATIGFVLTHSGGLIR